jgi:hypothetical protein
MEYFLYVRQCGKPGPIGWQEPDPLAVALAAKR